MTATRALDRGLRVLEALAGRPDGLAFGAVAAVLGTSNTSTARLLKALEELGYVSRDGVDGHYRTGPALTRLNPPSDPVERLRRATAPFLPWLRERCGATAMAVARLEGHMLSLERALHEDGLPMYGAGTVHAHHRYVPWGWIFRGIEWWHEERDVLDHQRTPLPPLSLIRAELARVATDGYCVQELPDRCRIAAPVVDGDGVVRAALVVGAFASVLGAERRAAAGRCVAEAARAASAALGAPPSPQPGAPVP